MKYHPREISRTGNKAQRKLEKLLQKLSAEIITENYHRKLSGEIITENYELIYQSRRKCEIYRDTGVSKKVRSFSRFDIARN